MLPDDVDLKFKIKLDGERTVVVNVEEPSAPSSSSTRFNPARSSPGTAAGPVVVNIVSGALTYIDAETCAGRTYSAGEAFVDPGQGHVHSADHPTSSPTVFIATFFDAPEAGSLLIPANDPGC